MKRFSVNTNAIFGKQDFATVVGSAGSPSLVSFRGEYSGPVAVDHDLILKGSPGATLDGQLWIRRPVKVEVEELTFRLGTKPAIWAAPGSSHGKAVPFPWRAEQRHQSPERRSRRYR